MSTPGAVGSVERAPSHDIRRTLLALAVAAQGAIDLASALLSHPPERLLALRRLVPTSVIDSSRTFTLLAGALLLVTAWGLRRGKRRAYVAALFLAALSVPVNLLKAIDVEEATVASALMFALGVNADAFRVKSRELTWSAIRMRFVWTALGLAFYAVVGCWIVEARWGNGASVVRAAAEAAYRVFGVGSPVLVLREGLPHHTARFVGWFLNSLGLLGFTVLLGAAVASLRPAIHRQRHRAERARVSTIIALHGDSSVAAFALAPDADYFFSRSGRAVIAYRFESDTLLAIGDPIGPPEDLPSLLRDFERFADDRDWTFAFFQSRPEQQPLYRSLGWRALHIGEDPIIDVASFSLDGSAMGDVRRSHAKLERAGIQALHWRPGVKPFDPSHDREGFAHQLASISSEWLKRHPGEEKGFCMGRFDQHRLRESWLAIAWDPATRRVEAFLTWVPIPARRGWALDLMRRRHDATAGIMEFLVAASVEEARARGDAILSLSLSALAKAETPGAAGAPGTSGGAGAAPAPEPEEPAAVVRARALLVRHLARFYAFEGLFRWKSKFQPGFEPRYLVYPHPIALPRVALALARAQTPGGLRTYWRRREPAQEIRNSPEPVGV
jgi:phosphatidylglycerol lysyltransferase